MNRAEKQAEVANLADKFKRSAAFFVADYKGITVEQVTTLRKELRGFKNVEMKVVKNSLAWRAMQDQPYGSALESSMVGTNAIIFVYGDPSGPAKTLVKYAEEFEPLKIKNGMLSGKKVEEAGIKALATLPSREVLLAKVLGSLNAPAQNMVMVLAAVPRSLLNVLNAVKAQKETQS